MYPIEKYNFVTYEQKNNDGSISKVVLAMSTYCGKVVKGIAKCISTDNFDVESGKKLAAARCDLKVCEKRRKRAFKKYEEAQRIVKQAKEYEDRMHDYFDEANFECIQSKFRLANIESKLG